MFGLASSFVQRPLLASKSSSKHLCFTPEGVLKNKIYYPDEKFIIKSGLLMSQDEQNQNSLKQSFGINSFTGN